MADRQFTIKISINDSAPFVRIFAPEPDPIFSHENWLSNEKDMFVARTFWGRWMVYRCATMKRLRFWSYPTKEVAAFAGCLAWGLNLKQGAEPLLALVAEVQNDGDA